MKIIPANARGRTVIGRLGENEHKCIEFRETAELLEMYPEAAVTVLHQRPGDPDAYPVPPEYVQVIAGVVQWTVQSGDLARTGDGLCEVALVQDSVVAKTLIYQTEILDALDGAGEPPDPWKGWQKNVTDTADLARGYADGKHLDGSDNTSLSENNAKYYSKQAEAAAGHYPKIESGTWWVWDVQSGAFVDTHITAQGPAGQDGTDGQDGAPGRDGQDGRDGTDGADGEDGVSPTITVTDITGGHRITVTDATGDHSFDVMDGSTPSVPVQDVQVNGTSVLNNGVANIPIAKDNAFGVIKTSSGWLGTATNNDGLLYIVYANDTQVKLGKDGYKAIVPLSQHKSTFYGLAKAAGDSTQSASSNAVGTYTETAKSKISEMLDAPETVSGSTPTITAKPGVRYICGEVSTLTITAPESGIIDVVFESGSTPTVLTVTSAKANTTIKWANGFDPSSLNANATYKISIMDGELGAVLSWT